MLIRIKHDAFNIARRIKSIDKGYFLCFNTITKRFEVHNSKQRHTFCLVVENKQIDCRVLSQVFKTRRENIDKILAEIDKHNKMLENQSKTKMLDKSSFMFKEMFSYASHHEGDVNFTDAYKTRWA